MWSASLQDWQKVSSTRAVNRYYPPAVRAAVTQLLVAREHRQVFEKATSFQYRWNIQPCPGSSDAADGKGLGNLSVCHQADTHPQDVVSVDDG